MRHAVFLTNDAAHDLQDIYNFIYTNDAPARAGHVLDQIERAVNALARFPNRGNHPKELLALGMREYREVFFKPYRIIYRTIEKSVYVYLIADGRRDMQTLLARRLLSAE
jgi:toxin ParE1/3/4